MSGRWSGEERRAGISDEQIDAIAERAAEHALRKVYEEVGRSTVKFILWVAGAAVLALLAYLGATGKLKV